MRTLQSRVVVDGLLYPEGIRWHQGKVWFSDILDLRVLTFDPLTGRTETVVQTRDRPSGLGFLPDGRLLIACMGDCVLLRLDPDGLKPAADLRPVTESLNDMVVGPQGHAYLDGRARGGGSGAGTIILVTPGGEYRVVAGEMNTPNGLSISADGKTLVANDLFGNKIIAFDVTPDGSLANRRVFADLKDLSPDGVCMDAEGAVWVGLPFQGEFRRIKMGGEVTHRIACENRWGVAPVLGGRDRRTLYLCTAEVTREQIGKLMRDPSSARGQCRGWIEAVGGIEVPGAGWP